MKRDMELVKKILLQVESDEDPLDLGACDQELIKRHVELLVEAGLLDSNITYAGHGDIILLGKPRLTWDGHEFLDAARNPMIWTKARDIIFDEVTSASFTVLKALLTNLLLSELGIDRP